MTKTSVEIDENLVEQARRVLGTSSIEETIDAALREVLSGDARRQEIMALAEMDGLDLANEERHRESLAFVSSPRTPEKPELTSTSLW